MKKEYRIKKNEDFQVNSIIDRVFILYIRFYIKIKDIGKTESRNVFFFLRYVIMGKVLDWREKK